jgi:hypothetical protein
VNLYSDYLGKAIHSYFYVVLNIASQDIPTNEFTINNNIITGVSDISSTLCSNFNIPSGVIGMAAANDKSISANLGQKQLTRICDDANSTHYYIGKNFFKDTKLNDNNEISLNNCDEIKDNAFQNVNINNIKPLINVKKIGNDAFNSSLATFSNISAPLCADIGNNTFANNKYLTTASFPGAQSIGDSAFANTPLSKIEIGAKADGTPISYNNCLKNSGILSSSINNKKIIVPFNNLYKSLLPSGKRLITSKDPE